MLNQIKEIVEEALYRIDGYSDDALVLVLRTGQVESKYKALRQYGDGPAIGFWQVEPATAEDIWKNYIAYRPHYEKAMLSLGYDPENLEFSLLSNIAVQAAFCRFKYKRDKNPIPSWDDLKAQGEYWKKVYNTYLGKGTVEHFIKANEGLFSTNS